MTIERSDLFVTVFHIENFAGLSLYHLLTLYNCFCVVPNMLTFDVGFIWLQTVAYSAHFLIITLLLFSSCRCVRC